MYRVGEPPSLWYNLSLPNPATGKRNLAKNSLVKHSWNGVPNKIKLLCSLLN